MSKIFNFYTKDENGVDVDRVWYQSSNIKYSECLDHDNELKTLTVVFNNGTRYTYRNVDVVQYLLFRDAESQGKALNQYIKPNDYPYEKLENADIDALDEELNFRIEGGMFINYDGDRLSVRDNKDHPILEKTSRLNKEAIMTFGEILQCMGKSVKIKYDDSKLEE